MKKISALLALTFMSVPVLAFAQNTFYLENIFTSAKYFLNLLIPILMVLATLYFMWTVYKFISAKDATKRKEEQGKMIAGIIGLFIIVSVWGIIRILGITLGIGQGGGAPNPVCPPGTTWNTTLKQCR
jgi:4-amino-4-deoxy-L-arabinose transferase-like glycosyltransferase